MKRDLKLFIQDILESCERIENYTNGISETDFSNNHKIQDAVMRRLGIIGEAVKNLPTDFRQRYPDINWRQIAGMRDILTHEYFGIKLERVWNTIRRDVPELKKQILKILEEME